MAILQADGFVPYTRIHGPLPAAQALAPDAAAPADSGILDAIAPDQAVVKMTVAEILVLVPGVRFGGIVSARASFGRVGGDQGRAVVQIQPHVAFQSDGEA